MSQTRAILLNCAAPKNFISCVEPADLATLVGLGPRSGETRTGAQKPGNADVVGPSGMAMIAVVTNCCEFTA
jgi:hypothetical protein